LKRVFIFAGLDSPFFSPEFLKDKAEAAVEESLDKMFHGGFSLTDKIWSTSSLKAPPDYNTVKFVLFNQ